jgi:transcriptional regulator with XRE-family HTH domain
MQNSYGESFGARLSQVLSEKKLTFQGAGKRFGVSGVTLNQWARGNAPFSFQVLQQLHKIYGVDLNWLIAGEEKE